MKNLNTKIAENGKFIVPIPFKYYMQLGDSRRTAVARLLCMEKKFHQNSFLKEEYSKLINEYLNLGHMEEVTTEKVAKCYLPHQAVIRNTSTTTKLRVVFDASAKTSNGRSLNDILQIIAKWRKWEFVLAAEIEKIYR